MQQMIMDNHYKKTILFSIDISIPIFKSSSFDASNPYFPNSILEKILILELISIGNSFIFNSLNHKPYQHQIQDLIFSNHILGNF